MELMYNFIKEKLNGRIWMKPINIFELQEDVANYLLKGKITRYDKTFEKKLHKLPRLIDWEGEECYISVKERTMEVEESRFRLEGFKIRFEKGIQKEKERNAEKYLREALNK
jgi:hypothetical protein